MVVQDADSEFIVLEYDYGIRPRGSSDACFYCKRRVGEFHARDCVVIVQMSVYEVIWDGRLLGHWRRYDPAFWDADFCNFHKNESSWCADNMLTSGEANFDLSILPQEPTDGDSCALCWKVEFVFVERSGEVVRASEENDGK